MAHEDTARTVIPVGRRWLALLPLVGLVELVVGIGQARVADVLLGLALVGLGVLGVTTSGTTVDERGVRPHGRPGRYPWEDVTGVVTSDAPALANQVGLVVRGRRRPVWVLDPDRVVLAAFHRQPRRAGPADR